MVRLSGLWAMWSSGWHPCPRKGCGTRQSLMSLLDHTILWFHDSMIPSYGISQTGWFSFLELECWVINRFGLVDQTGKKMQMFCYESLTGWGEGNSLEQLETEELRFLSVFWESHFSTCWIIFFLSLETWSSKQLAKRGDRFCYKRNRAFNQS